MPQKGELETLRMKLVLRAGVWCRAQGRATLRLAVSADWRSWWLDIIDKLKCPLPPFNEHFG
jgi:hypothetical protein